MPLVSVASHSVTSGGVAPGAPEAARRLLADPPLLPRGVDRPLCTRGAAEVGLRPGVVPEADLSMAKGLDLDASLADTATPVLGEALGVLGRTPAKAGLRVEPMPDSDDSPPLRSAKVVLRDFAADPSSAEPLLEDATLASPGMRGLAVLGLVGLATIGLAAVGALPPADALGLLARCAALGLRSSLFMTMPQSLVDHAGLIADSSTPWPLGEERIV